MLTSSDLICLPYTPDLTRAGIAYACRTLTRGYVRISEPRIPTLRQIVTEVAVELALRRYLAAEDIPYDNLKTAPFTHPDRYDISFGGRLCGINLFRISDKTVIRHLHNDLGALFQASALVPKEQLESETLQDKDIYIFSFVTALITDSRAELERALRAGQPANCIHPLPDSWVRPKHWVSLGTLVLKSNSTKVISLELGGRGENRDHQTEPINLPPRCRVQTQGDFYTVAYMQSPILPDGRIGIHSPGLSQTHIVGPQDWGNIWVYGMDIILAGYLTRGEFRRNAHHMPSGSRILGHERIRTQNMAVPLSQLRPIDDLFERTRKWAR